MLSMPPSLLPVPEEGEDSVRISAVGRDRFGVYLKEKCSSYL
jgi:hypothetical protein